MHRHVEAQRLGGLEVDDQLEFKDHAGEGLLNKS